MALIECSKCKTQISDMADKCPACGNSVRIEKNNTSDKPARKGIGCWTLIIIFLIGFSFIMIMTQSDNTKNTSTNRKQTKTISSQKLNNEELKKIQISYEQQNVFENERQRFIVTVRNTSEKQFNGSIRVEADDLNNSEVDSDTILDVDLPPSAQKAAMLFFKEPAHIVSLKYQVFGNLEAVSTTKLDVPFEVLNLCPGQSAMGIYIYTPAKDRASLQKIVKIYKKRYASLNMLNIQFFSDRKGKHDCYDLSDDALSCCIGSYWLNKTSGLDELKVVGPGETHL